MKKKMLVVLVLMVIGAVGGFFGTRYLERQRCTKEIDQITLKHNDELVLVSREAENWVNLLAIQQGETILRAFTAGISPLVLAERKEGIELSSVSLLRVIGVAGIHIVRINGGIIYSSDAKLTTTGQVDDRGAWALTAKDILSKPSQRDGFMEFALPIMDSGKTMAIVWLEYNLAEVINANRPSSLTPQENPLKDSLPSQVIQ